MNFFGVGPAEAGLVFVIALIVVGPQRFPEIMRSAGRWYRMARAYSNEVMKDVRAAVDDIEREVKAETDDLNSVRDLADVRKDLREARESVDEVRRDTKADAAGTSRVRPSKSSAGSSVSDDESTGPTKPAETEPDPPAAQPDDDAAATRAGVTRASRDANGGNDRA